AMAASTALPPARSASSPASTARRSAAATMARSCRRQALAGGDAAMGPEAAIDPEAATGEDASICEDASIGGAEQPAQAARATSSSAARPCAQPPGAATCRKNPRGQPGLLENLIKPSLSPRARA